MCATCSKQHAAASKPIFNVIKKIPQNILKKKIQIKKMSKAKPPDIRETDSHAFKNSNHTN